MTTTLEIVLPIMVDTYGDGAMVHGAAADVSKFIDTYVAGYRPFEQDLTNKIWDWFSGGNTAASVADKIAEALSVNARGESA